MLLIANDNRKPAAKHETDRLNRLPFVNDCGTCRDLLPFSNADQPIDIFIRKQRKNVKHAAHEKNYRWRLVPGITPILNQQFVKSRIRAIIGRMTSSDIRATLASYLPKLVLERLATDANAVREPIADHRRGSVLIADVSGFTSITER